MRLRQQEAKTVRHALIRWKVAGDIDEPLARRLEQSIEVVPFEWKTLAKYSFWTSIICIVIAIAAAISDEYLVKFLMRIFDMADGIKSLCLAFLSGLVYFVAVRLRGRHPERIFSNEAFLFLGVLTTAAAIYEFGRAIDSGSGHFSLLILLSYIIYAILGYGFRSNLVWLFSLLSLGGWMGAETGYASGWGAYYLGLNYPLRFVLFGGVLTAAAMLLGNNPKFSFLYKTTLATGLLYLFVSLWLLSIFGNYGDMDSWYESRQIELFHWSLLFAIVALAAIYHGLRRDSTLTKGFGITFLFINLYTRYFELFWNQTHKAIFFALLALSFWLLGRKAEKIWTLGRTARSTK